MRLPRGIVLFAGIALSAAPGQGFAEPLAGSFGNETGCVGVVRGYQDTDDYMVLTAAGVETYGTGCQFARQLDALSGTQLMQSVCSAEGEAGTTNDIVKVANRGSAGYFVTLPGLEEWGPLKPCS